MSRVDTCLQSNVSSGVSTEQKPDQKKKKFKCNKSQRLTYILDGDGWMTSLVDSLQMESPLVQAVK